ncbi:hypothetical protein CIPAW_07G141700 [Carya illinoinensis]|uniref:Uncharacterized protein n=1 Tax=Carya illinoinensis TaxID=32201 RepID=A0A8T1Q2T9_CARIL|nr:hypothetical protein CIPAW_07G141700 [Carya illinoinensis]
MLRFGQITLTASQLLQNLDVIKHTIQRSSETMVDTSEFDPELVLSPEFPEFACGTGPLQTNTKDNIEHRCSWGLRLGNGGCERA